MHACCCQEMETETKARQMESYQRSRPMESCAIVDLQPGTQRQYVCFFMRRKDSARIVRQESKSRRIRILEFQLFMMVLRKSNRGVGFNLDLGGSACVVCVWCARATLAKVEWPMCGLRVSRPHNERERERRPCCTPAE
jgi:hypothetical protein